MAQEFEIISANLLPAATNITDNDMILIIQGARVKRALPSAMKGKQGDPGPSPYLGVTETHIQWKQGSGGTWQNLIALEKLHGEKGEKPLFRKQSGSLQMKYEGEPDTAYKNIFDREELKLSFSDLTPEEIDRLKLHFSDLTDADKAQLMKPAIEAATEARQTVAAIQSAADAAIQSATEAAEMAETAAGNVQDGKTPVITIGTVEAGPAAAATLTPAGTDESGNPKSALNLVLPKGKDGEPPVVNYSVLTGDPGTEVKVNQEEGGFTPEGNPIYHITLTIPRGERGLPGLGSGNVYVDGTGLLAGEKYLFVPSATDSTEGTFVKYEDAPVDGKSYARKDGQWVEIGETYHTLDLSPLFDPEGNPVSEVSDEFIAELQKAYDKKYSNCTANAFDNGLMPLTIQKIDDNIIVSPTVIASTTETLFLLSYEFQINTTSKTLSFNPKGIQLKTEGDGTTALTDDGSYRPFLGDAPLDGKVYARKNGKWSEVEATSKNEMVKIVVTSNQAQPDADLTGAVITVTYAGSDKTIEWNGTEISTDVPVGIEFTVSCGNISGYATPQTRTFTAIASNTRIVTLSYNTTITTINVTSNQSESDFVNAVTVNLTGGITKTLTGALSYTIKIPTGTTYNITGSEVAPSTDKRYTTPASKPVTATGTTQTTTISYTGCKLNITVGTDKGSVTPTITVLKGSDTLDSWAIASGSTKSIIVPLNTLDRYTIKGGPANDYKAQEDISGIIPSSILISKTFTYTYWSEDEYSYWVIFDESTPTTKLERGGNEAVRDSIRAKFKRCLAMPQANGKAAIAYLNETDSTKWPDGSKASFVIDGDRNGKNIMVHFPKYYYRNEDLGNERYKYYISEIKFNDKYKEERECLIGVFEGYNYNQRLCSWYNVGGSYAKTIKDFYESARNNGAKWGLIDYRAHRTIANMFCIMYGNTDISTDNPDIPCSGGNKPYSQNYGSSGGTIYLGNLDGKAIAKSATLDTFKSTSFIGVEDCYYSKYEFVQGINIINREWIVYDGGLSTEETVDQLISKGFTNVRLIGTANNGYGFITEIKHGEYADVMPIVCNNGSSTTYYADYYYDTTGSVFLMRSGSSDQKYNCGVFHTSATSPISFYGESVGSRLGFYGTIEVKTKDEWLALTPDFNG